MIPHRYLGRFTPILSNPALFRVLWEFGLNRVIKNFHISTVTFWQGCLSGPVVLLAMAALFGSAEVITASIRAWRKLLQPPALMFDRIIRKLSVLVITGAHLFWRRLLIRTRG